MYTSNTRRQPRHSEFQLEEGLDALVCGDCTEDEFVVAALDLYDSKSATNLIARIDQYYQRGQLPDPIFRSVKSKITQRVIERAIDEVDDVVTSDAHSPSEATDAASPPPTVRASGGNAGPQPPSPAAEPVLPIGQLLKSRYTVQNLLARGRTADVFRALDGFTASAAPGHQVTVKILREPIERCGERIEGLRREFECLRRLTHQNIVKVYEFEQDESTAFYTMEVLDGERLSDVIKRADKKPLPRFYARAVVGAIGAALAHAHAHDVIHGDLSPDNILISSSGELRVLNFGAPGVSDADSSAYASCELLEGQSADPRDDIFALACLACELLGGAHPFQGRRATEARERGMVAHRPQGIGVFQWRAIETALSWSRDARPAAIRQWLAALGLEPEPARLPPIDQDIHRKPAMRVKRIAFVAALSILAVVGFSFFWRSIDHIADNMGSKLSETPSIAPTAPTPPPPEVQTDTPAASLASNASDEAPDAAGPPRRVQSAPAAASAARPTIKFTAKRLAVAPGTGFAEIHVWRSRVAADLSDFIWWTEDSSAKSGVDFVAQDRTTHPFSHGARSATIFVKLLPRVAGARPASFRVCAGKASGDAANDVTCSAVVLPARG